MSRFLKIGVLVLVGIVVTGLALPIIMRARASSERTNCQNHLRQLGLDGVRHAATPGLPLPLTPQHELPPGTFLNPTLKPDERMSWYVYTLNMLDQGMPNDDPKAKKKAPLRGLGNALGHFEARNKWDEGRNAELARFKLTTALCPSQVPTFADGAWITSNYIAVGGLGANTPALDLADAGALAGVYRYDGPTPDKAIKDGLQQTAQFIETNVQLGPWLQGGPATLRGLDTKDTPYLGVGRPFGGCHAGGTYVAMADGSVQFVRDTIAPAVFRAMWTIAGAQEAESFDTP
jgi:prepilin-type processing-associated H-X9-DG protein